MSTFKIGGIALIAVGVLGLVYGGFTYTKETHQAKIGSLEMSVNDNETVNVPVWAGVAAVVAGGLLLIVPKGS
jgi:TRAP-type C4-dicarboxylate transport system permease small subunit